MWTQINYIGRVQIKYTLYMDKVHTENIYRKVQIDTQTKYTSTYRVYNTQVRNTQKKVYRKILTKNI